MKKQVLSFVAVIIVIAIAVVVSNQENDRSMQTAGGFPRGKSLKELNDSAKSQSRSKTNVVAFAQANYSSEYGNLFQVMTIGNWESQFGNRMFVGADVVGTVSTQFGVMCPTYNVRGGVDFGAWRVEGKVGNFTRNSVTTTGFDPQFSNFCVLAGESAPVANAMQIAFVTDGLKLYVGHQAGGKFYTLNDGNYYAGVEKRLGNFSISGGADFAHTIIGYADVKWMWQNNAFTLTCNKLGGEEQNFVLSYVRSGLPLGKGIRMNLGTALWKQSEQSGLQLVAGLNKGKFTLFTQTGGYLQSGILTPTIGLGMNCNL